MRSRPGWLRPPRRVRALLATPRGRRIVLLVKRSVREHLDDHCQQMAAAIAYHLLFSLFPLAIGVVAVLGLISRDPQTRQSVIDGILKAVPLSESGQDDLRQMIDSISSNTGAIGLVGFLALPYSASGVMAAVRTALNVAWDTQHHRPFLRGKAVDMLLLLATFVIIGAALGLNLLTSLAREGGERLPGGLGWLAGTTSTVLSIALALALLFTVFALLFRFVPAVPTRLSTIWPGALVAAVGLEALQWGFSLYVSNFANYNRIYGSLGAVIAFLFFVYLASSVFLFAAEVASEYPRLPSRLPSPQTPKTVFRPSVADGETADGSRAPSGIT